MLPILCDQAYLCAWDPITVQKTTDANMNMKRSEQKEEDTWNLSPLYPSYEKWKEDLQEESSLDYATLMKPYRITPKFTPPQLKELFELNFSLSRRLQNLYTWAHLRHDQDIADDENKQAMQSIMARHHHFSEQTAWIEPKILEHEPEDLATLTNAEELAPYKTLLDRLVRLKAHTLPAEQESLMAMSGRALGAPHSAFSSLNDADFTFPDVADKEGEFHPLTHGSYSVLLRSTDRVLRQNAFEAIHNKYQKYENTFAELLGGEIHAHHFEAKARKYSSCLEMALWPKNIPTSVYHALIDSVHRKAGVLHRYMKLKKQLLGVESLKPWDLYAPLVPEKTSEYSFDEAVELIQSACHPLGLSYLDTLKKGLTTERWSDKYENENKRSGAYSSGCYDSPPYMLLNYKGKLRDVFTLAHEAGHSMHSQLSKTQPFHYSHYNIFVAEVASTFNEELLAKELLKRAEGDVAAQASLLNERLEDLRATLFRQALFAEFELFIHERIEKDEPLTPKILNEKYMDLYRLYYGDDLILTPEFASEWARIPHFYYYFYVYQYATGISAAQALAERVTTGGEKEREEYLSFLKGGSSLFPIDLLKGAGVDMTTGEAIEKAIDHFDSLLDQFEALLPQLKTQVAP